MDPTGQAGSERLLLGVKLSAEFDHCRDIWRGGIACIDLKSCSQGLWEVLQYIAKTGRGSSMSTEVPGRLS